MGEVEFYWKWRDDAPEGTPRKIEDIVGKIPVNISIVEESRCENEAIVFLFEDGTACKFMHAQDCCETVLIDDVNGDWNDLIGTPLLVAESRTNSDLPPREDEYGSESSWTWTFYTFRSIKGSVDVRWYGESNGYYSEEVDFFGGILEP